LPIVYNSLSHNFLEPSGRVQTCTGIALLFCGIVIQSLKKLVFTFIFLKLLFIGLCGSALCDREVTVITLHFVSHSERQGTFVSVQQFCNLSN